MMVSDVTRAFLTALVRKTVFIELPPEDQCDGEETVGELGRSVYGTSNRNISVLVWRRRFFKQLEGTLKAFNIVITSEDKGAMYELMIWFINLTDVKPVWSPGMKG